MLLFWIVIIGIVYAILLGVSLYYHEVSWLRFSAIGLFFVLASAIYFTIPQFMGWPTNSKQSGYLVSVEIVEPTDISKGGIYLTLYPEIQNETFLSYNPPLTPRLYVLEYSISEHKKFSEVKRLLLEGFQIFLEAGNDSSGQGKDEGENNNNKGELPNLHGDSLFPDEDKGERLYVKDPRGENPK